MSSESLYFIAIVPPKDIQERITQLKMEVAEKFGSRHALKSPPHITLHMPFKWKDKKYDQLVSVMGILNNMLTPFEIELDGFGFFPPRVVFVDVVENVALNALQNKVVDTCRKELKLDNANYRSQPFHPHVTIAFRDLKKQIFYKAKKEFEFRVFSCKFQIDKVSILRHDGNKWQLLVYE